MSGEKLVGDNFPQRYFFGGEAEKDSLGMWVKFSDAKSWASSLVEEAVKKAVKELGPYLRHKVGCEFEVTATCDCGFDDAVNARTGGGK